MNHNGDPPPPPLSLPQPHRPSTPCDRHPQERFTVFCPSCLCERLRFLDPSPSSSSSSSRKPPIAATTSTAAAALKAIFKPSGESGSRPGFFPELRRTRSFSASKNEGLSGGFEPQRKSWSLFSQDYERNPHKREAALNLGSSSSVVQGPTDHQNDDVQIVEEQQQSDVGVDFRSLIEEKVEEIVQEEELKAMKDHIDVDSQTKKKSSGSFWSAASIFSKKLQQWRQKQKLKKMKNGGGSVRYPTEKKPIGRRSCDIDPRLSLDGTRRMSFDNPRFSFDEARASWDGHLIGTGRTTFQRIPSNTKLSLIEHAQIPIEDPLVVDSVNGESLPGGSAQTRDYYSDSRRRKSLDRSSSIRKTAAAVVAEIDEIKSISTAKVSPAIVDCRDSNSNSNSEIFEIGKGDSKKSRRWSKAWNFLGFIHRRSVKKDEDEEDRHSRGANGVERSYSYSESRSELRGGFNPKLSRSNSCVSWRGSSGLGGSFGGSRKGGVESNGRLSFDSASMSCRGGSSKSRANHAHSNARRLY